MGGAPEAEETLRFGVIADAEIFDRPNAGAGEPRRDIAGKVEQGVAWPRRRLEKTVIGRIVRQKSVDEVGPDLVVRLTDRRSDRGGDAHAVGTEALHRGDRRVGDARERAAPARV